MKYDVESETVWTDMYKAAIYCNGSFYELTDNNRSRLEEKARKFLRANSFPPRQGSLAASAELPFCRYHIFDENDNTVEKKPNALFRDKNGYKYVWTEF